MASSERTHSAALSPSKAEHSSLTPATHRDASHSSLGNDLLLQCGCILYREQHQSYKYWVHSSEAYGILNAYPALTERLQVIGLGPLLQVLPSYVDLPLVTQFLSTVVKSTRSGVVTNIAGDKVTVTINRELIRLALNLPIVPKPSKIPCKIMPMCSSLVSPDAAQTSNGPLFTDILDPDLVIALRFYHILFPFHHRDRHNRVDWTSLARLGLVFPGPHDWPTLFYKEFDLFLTNIIPKKKFVVPNAMLLTRILYTALGYNIPPCQINAHSIVPLPPPPIIPTSLAEPSHQPSQPPSSPTPPIPDLPSPFDDYFDPSLLNVDSHPGPSKRPRPDQSPPTTDQPRVALADAPLDSLLNEIKTRQQQELYALQESMRQQLHNAQQAKETADLQVQALQASLLTTESALAASQQAITEAESNAATLSHNIDLACAQRDQLQCKLDEQLTLSQQDKHKIKNLEKQLKQTQRHSAELTAQMAVLSSQASQAPASPSHHSDEEDAFTSILESMQRIAEQLSQKKTPYLVYSMYRDMITLYIRAMRIDIDNLQDGDLVEIIRSLTIDQLAVFVFAIFQGDIDLPNWIPLACPQPPVFLLFKAWQMFFDNSTSFVEEEDCYLRPTIANVPSLQLPILAIEDIQSLTLDINNLAPSVFATSDHHRILSPNPPPPPSYQFYGLETLYIHLANHVTNFATAPDVLDHLIQFPLFPHEQDRTQIFSLYTSQNQPPPFPPPPPPPPPSATPSDEPAPTLNPNPTTQESTPSSSRAPPKSSLRTYTHRRRSSSPPSNEPPQPASTSLSPRPSLSPLPSPVESLESGEITSPQHPSTTLPTSSILTADDPPQSSPLLNRPYSPQLRPMPDTIPIPFADYGELIIPSDLPIIPPPKFIVEKLSKPHASVSQFIKKYPEEINRGGYIPGDPTLTKIHKANMGAQPSWRIQYLKVPKYWRIYCKSARELRVNPRFHPCLRRNPDPNCLANTRNWPIIQPVLPKNTPPEIQWSQYNLLNALHNHIRYFSDSEDSSVKMSVLNASLIIDLLGLHLFCDSHLSPLTFNPNIFVPPQVLTRLFLRCRNLSSQYLHQLEYMVVTRFLITPMEIYRTTFRPYHARHDYLERQIPILLHAPPVAPPA